MRGIDPVVLSDSGNLTVHLSPHPVVARVAKLFPGDDAEFWRTVWRAELQVTRHLSTRGVPVVPPCVSVHPGPHPIAGTWMTLWEYMRPAALPPLSGEHAVGMIDDLTQAIADFQGPLAKLGAWRHLAGASEHLRATAGGDARIAHLVAQCERVDARMRSVDALYPAHGDAHPGNLLATPAGWRWIDFEDASRMPRFWDRASFIGNTALFHGVEHPIVRHVLAGVVTAADRAAFGFALRARLVMATACNLSLALRGWGDLDFAQAQLQRLGGFLARLDEGLWTAGGTGRRERPWNE